MKVCDSTCFQLAKHVCVDAKLKGECSVKENINLYFCGGGIFKSHFSCQSKLGLWSLQESVSLFRCRIICIIAHGGEAFMT